MVVLEAGGNGWVDLSLVEFLGVSQSCSYCRVMRNLLLLPSRRDVVVVMECGVVVIMIVIVMAMTLD